MRILAVSCDAYADAHEPFKALFHRFWPDCPYPFDFAVDHSGSPANWSRFVCEQIQGMTEPVLLLQEDFFLNAPVNVDLMKEAVDVLHSHCAGAVRVYPCPGADTDFGHPRIGFASIGSPYRISCQATIWRPDYLKTIAMECTTAADFEIKGSRLSAFIKTPVLAWLRETKDWPISYICTGIVRGKWIPDSLALFKKHGIPVDTTRRPIAC